MLIINSLSLPLFGVDSSEYDSESESEVERKQQRKREKLPKEPRASSKKKPRLLGK